MTLLAVLNWFACLRLMVPLFKTRASIEDTMGSLTELVGPPLISYFHKQTCMKHTTWRQTNDSDTE